MEAQMEQYLCKHGCHTSHTWGMHDCGQFVESGDFLKCIRRTQWNHLSSLQGSNSWESWWSQVAMGAAVHLCAALIKRGLRFGSLVQIDQPTCATAQQYNGCGIVIRNCIPPHFKEIRNQRAFKQWFLQDSTWEVVCSWACFSQFPSAPWRLVCSSKRPGREVSDCAWQRASQSICSTSPGPERNLSFSSFWRIFTHWKTKTKQQTKQFKVNFKLKASHETRKQWSSFGKCQNVLFSLSGTFTPLLSVKAICQFGSNSRSNLVYHQSTRLLAKVCN